MHSKGSKILMLLVCLHVMTVLCCMSLLNWLTKYAFAAVHLVQGKASSAINVSILQRGGKAA